MSQTQTTISDQMGKNGFVWFHGVVEDIKDPLKLGRVRVRCFEFHNGDKQKLPTNHLPWATPLLPVTSPSVSGKGISPTGLLQGSWVIGFFRDGLNCQDPIILGSFAGIPQLKEGTTSQYSDPTLGFNDPDGIWPTGPTSVTTGGYGGEQDTNRLARGENLQETILRKKLESTRIGIQTSLHPWLVWDELPTSYAAEYPKNHVLETESGHVVELDDTPNKERISLYHKAGTWFEIHPDGSRVQKIKGDDYEISMSDKKVLIQGNCYMNMDGPITTLKTGRDFYIEIGGDLHLFTRGNVVMETGGNFEHRVHGSYTVASDGPMMFVAPRIDFNPEGVNPSMATNPAFAGGKNIPPLFKNSAIFPSNTFTDDKVDKYLSTDQFKKLFKPSSLPDFGSNAPKSAQIRSNQDDWLTPAPRSENGYTGILGPMSDEDAQKFEVELRWKSYYDRQGNSIPWDSIPSVPNSINIDEYANDKYWEKFGKERVSPYSAMPDGTTIRDAGEQFPNKSAPSNEQLRQNNQSLLEQKRTNDIKQNVNSKIDQRIVEQTEANIQQTSESIPLRGNDGSVIGYVTPSSTISSESVNAISPGAVGGQAGLFDEVGGFLGNVEEGIVGTVNAAQSVLPEGINLGTLAGIGSGALLGGALGPVGGVVGGAFAGALAFINPAAANLAVNVGANVSTATVPSPSSYLNVSPEGITNLSAIPLAPISPGMAGQSIVDTNLVNIGAPGIPTESLYAVPGGTATIIAGYPGRSQANSATRGIPAIPIVTFESQFPSMKQKETTEVDGGVF